LRRATPEKKLTPRDPSKPAKTTRPATPVARSVRISRRLILPAVPITLALAALALLATTPTEPSPRVASKPRKLSPSQPAGVARVQPGAPRPGRPGSVHFEPPKPGSSQSPRQLAPAAPAIPPLPANAPAAAAPGPNAPASTGFLYEIENAPDLMARLAILDRLLPSQTPDQLAELIAKLLEHPPGPPEEVSAARVSYLHRLGFVPGVRADEMLCAATAPDRPKGERLTAIEGLGRIPGRQGAARKLDLLTYDADPDVARRARRALGQDQ